MTGSARWARGARSPDAPTLPCEGTTGWMPRRSSSQQPLDELGPAARVAQRQRVGAQQQHGTDDVGRKRLADAGGVAEQQALLQLACTLRWHERRGQRAEAGGHAVDDLAGGHQSLDDRARLGHPSTGVLGQYGRASRTGHRFDVGDGQLGTIEDDRSVESVVVDGHLSRRAWGCARRAHARPRWLARSRRRRGARRPCLGRW